MANWSKRAACRDADPELFFPVSKVDAKNQDQIRRAKKICARCPVRKECLQEAMDSGAEGVFGGTTEQERRELRRSGKRVAS